MKIRTVLGVTALLLAAAIPATGLGQRIVNGSAQNGVYGRYGQGRQGVTQLRVGGATVYFGPGGGGYGYSAPVLGYAYPYPMYGGYLSPLGYGYPTYPSYGYLGYGYGGYGY